MLVLTRKQDQTIRIGHDIVITVVKCNGQVKLGIEAPANVPISRDNMKESKS